MLKAIIQNIINSINAPLLRIQERTLILQSKKLARDNSNLESIRDLTDVEFSVSSQWGEDGIIDWLVSKLPSIPKTFVEFGVENYRESNTRYLLQSNNWRGLVFDGSKNHIQNIRRQEIYWRHRLKAETAFIDKDNINQLIENGGMSGDVGLLSVDIDGNDYWVWQAINVINPAIVVIEYNAVLGDLHSLTVPYHPEFQRTKAHYSNLFFGASLAAVIKLGREKGYTFFGTTSSGVNAFFIRNDLCSFISGHIEQISAYPSSHREARDQNSNLLYIDGPERAAFIADLELIDITDDKMIKLRDIKDIYSLDWQSERKTKL